MLDRPSSVPCVVVGTDFSPASDAAVDRAIIVARDSGANVHVVHASGRLPAALARRFSTHRPRLAADLREVVKRAREAGVRATTEHVETSATKALRASARERGARLIVVGTRGRTLPDELVGSTAERIATLSSLPVLLVRRPGRSRYREIFVAVDREPEIATGVEAARFVGPDAKLSVLHVYEGAYETTLRLHGASTAEIGVYRRQARRQALSKLLPRLENVGLGADSLVLRPGDPRRLLHSLPKDALLVMRRGSVITHALLGSVTRAVIAHGRSDVLIT